MRSVDYFRSAVPTSVYPQMDPVSWRTNIMQFYKQIGDIDQNDARKQFVHVAEGLTLFGSSFFEFKVSDPARRSFRPPRAVRV